MSKGSVDSILNINKRVISGNFVRKFFEITYFFDKIRENK